MQTLKATYEELGSCKSKLEDEVLFLEKQLKEEKSKHSEKDELMADISQRVQTLRDELKFFTSEIAASETGIKISQMNIEQLRVEAEETFNENAQLQRNLNQFES
ncbi:melanoma inhibitory activity protein 2-like [Ochotona curzoniae]|uniref:melanoma inhibitory activity protein 2-like n=1 Tax=Ochotona curzoniae TaxID=130825 RepID=UPI001B349535|nr:melanoma inhibitory activity protein 2-like [Ochotona curzoniae]